MEPHWLLLCLVVFDGWTIARTSTIGTVSIQGSPTLEVMEDVAYSRIEFRAEANGAVKYGDLEIVYTIDDVSGMPDVEPGFDFTPSLGAFPNTFTVTIQEGATESNLFVLQVIDDCHVEDEEVLRFAPLATVAYTTNGDLYSVMADMLDVTISEGTADTESIEIQITPENPDLGIVIFEGETNAVIPITGFECRSVDPRALPIEVTCTATLTQTDPTNGLPLTNADFIISEVVQLAPDDGSFTIQINDDTVIEEPEVYHVGFKEAGCGTGNAVLVNDRKTEPFTIIDNDDEIFYGIVSPASIGRKESSDVNVYAITTQIDTDTTIVGNNAVCPFKVQLPPFCKSTDLTCDPSDVYGTNTVFRRPKRESRGRFGSYIITAAYSTPQSIPVFVLPTSDVLKPIRGPTITINDGEDVVIGVDFSSFTRELRWKFNGKELPKFSGKCHFEIKKAKYGTHDGYYEVTRVQRRDSGWRTIIRLIIRQCSACQFIGASSDCTDLGSPTTTCKCYNGGVCPSTFGGTDDWKCVCPLGFYGKRCATVYPGNIRIGPPAKGLTCRDLDKGISRDCRGVLFCYADPLGCLCARGYWGEKCDRVCPNGRFGASCLQRCNCVGPWDSCDPKTGVCKSGQCKTGFDGANCQVVE
ncbi:uncharacterized protein [Apostichopus japonicus]|uniref:uncharacterized protein n=1 Tax=Stichopus japonicus TaxID=307972 RepID=UPI003AB86843